MYSDSKTNIKQSCVLGHLAPPRSRGRQRRPPDRTSPRLDPPRAFRRWPRAWGLRLCAPSGPSTAGEGSQGSHAWGRKPAYDLRLYGLGGSPDLPGCLEWPKAQLRPHYYIESANQKIWASDPSCKIRHDPPKKKHCRQGLPSVLAWDRLRLRRFHRRIGGLRADSCQTTKWNKGPPLVQPSALFTMRLAKRSASLDTALVCVPEKA